MPNSHKNIALYLFQDIAFTKMRQTTQKQYENNVPTAIDGTGV